MLCEFDKLEYNAFDDRLKTARTLNQCNVIVDSSNTDLNSAWMGRGLRSVFDESTITYTHL